MKSKVVVFGGSGFLGSYVVDELFARDYRVVVADLRESPYLQDSQDFRLCDITDAKSVEDVVAGADIVFNFAGLADLDQCLENPVATMELNVIGNINVLEACVAQKVSRVVYASSAYALSTKGGFYGISKQTSERMTAEYFNRYGLPFTIIRYGSLYGERATEQNGIYRILNHAIAEGVLVFKGEGDEFREYIHALDAARLSVDILEGDQFINEHVVLTGVERLRQKELLQMIKEILNDEVDIVLGGQPLEGHYRATPYAEQKKLGKKLIANPYIDLGQGLLSCIENIRNQRNAREG